MPKKVTRTTAGLRDFMFDQLNAFKAGRVSPEEARAVSAIAGTIIETAKLELEYAKLRRIRVPTPLQLSAA